MMCAARVELTWSIIAASVVLLPLPVVPGHQHQAALFLGDPLEDRREPELVDVADAGRDDAEHHADRAALLEDVAAEAAEPGDAVGQVDFLRLAEFFLVLGREEHARHRFGVVAVEPLFLGGDEQCAIDPHHRVAADLEVQVGGSGRGGYPQEIIEMHAPTAVSSGERRAKRKSASRACPV